jgi:hypothetical protein
MIHRSIPPIGLLLGCLVGVLLAVILIIAGSFLRGSSYALIQANPVITQIRPEIGTDTPRPTISPSTQEQPSPTPPPPPAEGDLQVGILIEVVGTGGDGLRIREEPGLRSTVLFLGIEREVFEIQGGPTLKDGFEWWQLVNPFDEEKSGWAVSNYLQPVSE